MVMSIFLRAGLAGVLIAAGYTKLRDLKSFELVLSAHGLRPLWLRVLTARMVVASELTSASFLLLTATSRVGAVLAIGLFLAFSVELLWASRAFTKDIDCGCFGMHRRSSARPAHIISNLALGLVGVMVVSADVTGPAVVADAGTALLAILVVQGLVLFDVRMRSVA